MQEDREVPTQAPTEDSPDGTGKRIGVETSPGEVSPDGSVSNPRAELLEVPLDLIDLGPNIRKSNRFDLQDGDDVNMVASVKDGNQQPGEARRKGDGRFELIFGFRRYNALKAGGRATMLLMVTDRQYTPEEVIEKQLIENCQRKDMNPMDRAEAYAALKRKYKKARVVAEKVGFSENVVSEYLTVDSHLPAESKNKLRHGKMTFKSAYEEAKAKKDGAGCHKNVSADAENTTENGEGEETSPSEVSGTALKEPKHVYDRCKFRDDNTGLFFAVGGKRKAPPSTKNLIVALKNWLHDLEPTVTDEGQT